MNALEIINVDKHYKNFSLESVSLCVERGTVTGLIGENGAGKSTLIKAVLGLTEYDGEILANGKPTKELSPDEKKKTGFVLGDRSLPESLTVCEFSSVLRKFYGKAWEPDTFAEFVGKFGLPNKERIGELSTGMKAKCALAAALSHGADTLLLDEPTSGLDPVARDDILGVLYDFMQDETHSILISSHITSDLEKLCDRIVFMHEGKVLLDENKDDLLCRYKTVRGADEAERKNAVRIIRRSYGIDALVPAGKAGENGEYAGLDDIMNFFIRGEKQ